MHGRVPELRPDEMASALTPTAFGSGTTLSGMGRCKASRCRRDRREPLRDLVAIGLLCRRCSGSRCSAGVDPMFSPALQQRPKNNLSCRPRGRAQDNNCSRGISSCSGHTCAPHAHHTVRANRRASGRKSATPTRRAKPYPATFAVTSSWCRGRIPSQGRRGPHGGVGGSRGRLDDSLAE
jgi:hypothetical protein